MLARGSPSGLSVPVVKTRVHRARLFLRPRLPFARRSHQLLIFGRRVRQLALENNLALRQQLACKRTVTRPKLRTTAYMANKQPRRFVAKAA